MNESLKAALLAGSRSLGIMLTDEQIDKFFIYMDLLLEWNEKINLTAITEPEEVISKHFVDSLSLFTMDIPEGSHIIDVGTGAGFPSIPLLIARPDLKITMLDSLAKRLNFIREVLAAIGRDAELVHARAEDGGQDPKYREKYDIATARAVANLATLSEYCLPFVKKGGRFLAMKGDAQAEIDDAANALKILGGEVKEVKEITPEGAPWCHRIVEVKKISTTPSKYPRKAGKPAKEPLK